MKVVRFKYQGRFAHFLRAEANASAPSYPIPPRTALLGLIGAILGLAKDTPQEVLKDSGFSVSGKIPKSHWHSANLRKTPPATLPRKIKATSKGSGGSDEKNTIIAQEWLLGPSYEVSAALSSPFHEEFVERLQERRWHFTPCMGLSEMMADLVFEEEVEACPVKNEDCLELSGVIPQSAGNIDIQQASLQKLNLKQIRLPRCVSSDRVFIHSTYWLERDGKPIPFQTDKAWKAGNRLVIFM